MLSPGYIGQQGIYYKDRTDITNAEKRHLESREMRFSGPLDLIRITPCHIESNPNPPIQSTTHSPTWTKASVAISIPIWKYEPNSSPKSKQWTKLQVAKPPTGVPKLNQPFPVTRQETGQKTRQKTRQKTPQKTRQKTPQKTPQKTRQLIPTEGQTQYGPNSTSLLQHSNGNQTAPKQVQAYEDEYRTVMVPFEYMVDAETGEPKIVATRMTKSQMNREGTRNHTTRKDTQYSPNSTSLLQPSNGEDTQYSPNSTSLLQPSDGNQTAPKQVQADEDEYETVMVPSEYLFNIKTGEPKLVATRVKKSQMSREGTREPPLGMVDGMKSKLGGIVQHMFL